LTDNRSDENKAKDCEKNLGYLKDIRSPFEPQIDNIIKFVNHGRRSIAGKENKGQKTGESVYDGSAMGASNMLVDGMVGYLCSRNIRWFKFGIPGKFNFPRSIGGRNWTGQPIDSHPEVRRWLDYCEEVQYSAFGRSNFYDIVTEFIRDGATIGTSHLVAEEDVGQGRVMFTVPHFRECFIAEDQYGRVDTNYRVYCLTLRQLADKFGLDRLKALDRNFEKAYEDNFHQEREVIHAVYPRKDYSPDRYDSRAKRIASLWILRSAIDGNQQGSKLIEESGYDWMPSVTWRWRKNNDEWYGRSPAWDAFVDILKANEQGRSNLIAGQKMVEPPMIAPSDLRGQIQMGPKGQTFMDRELAAWAPRPLVTGIQLPYSVDQQDRTDKVIRDHFAVDFFLMLTMAAENKVDLTATQVIEMMGEKAAVLGTRVGMLQSEALDPIHDRVFDIEMRAGRMPEPPPILQDYAGGRIEIQYLGPLAQAQVRLSKSRSIQAGISLVAQIAAVSPTALDMVDWDGAVIEALDSSGFPAHLVRSDEQIAAIRQQRIAAEQKAQAVEALGPISKAMRAGKDKPEAGSPMGMLMNPEETQETAGAG
jgi:hypothetical protein